MQEWNIQCANCSKYFDATQAVSCKCFYQFPTKICPYCLKCFCTSKEAYREYWRNLPDGERKKIIGSKPIWKWLKEINLLSDSDINDILEEAKKLRITFMKAAYRLGYFDKDEVEKIKEIIYFTPDVIFEKVKVREQKWGVWDKYKGMIIDDARINNQNYSIVAFPMGVSSTSVFKVQAELKKLIIPIYIELTLWKMLVEEAKVGFAKGKNKEDSSFSLKEWFWELINEAIAEAREEILIESDINNDKSSIFFNGEGRWILYKSSDIPYRSLSWGIKNLIPEQGKKVKDDYYLNYKVFDNRIFLRIEPYKFNFEKGDNSFIQMILDVMQLRRGMLLLITDLYREALARTIIFHGKRDYSVMVNNLSIAGEDASFFKSAKNDYFGLSKYVAIIDDIEDIEEVMKISSMNFVVGISGKDISLKILENDNGNLIRAVLFWRFKKLCSKCKIKAKYIFGDNISLWQRNEIGCNLCRRGYNNDILIFEEYGKPPEEIISSLILGEEIDWRDLSFVDPKILMQKVRISE